MPQKMDPELAACVLEGLMRYSSVVLFVKRPDGQYLAVSDGWESVTGLTAEQTLQRDDVDIFGPEVGGAFRQADVQVMEAGHPMLIEESLLKPDGTQYFLSTKFPLRNQQQELLGICGVSSDITPLRRMQGALNWIISAATTRTGASLLQAFTTHAAQVIHADYCLIGRLESDGQLLQTLAFVMQDKLLDNAVIPLQHSPFAQIDAPDVRLYASNVQALFPKDELLKKLEIEGYAGIPVFGSDGCKLGLLLAFFKQPIRAADFVCDLFKLFSDRIAAEIERQQWEHEIIQLNADLEKRVAIRTSELQHALQEVEMFNHCVSHDLKAPLRAVKGFANILLEDELDRLSADGKEMLGRIVNAANRMQAQIDALGKLVKLDAIPLARKALDLSGMAQRVADACKQILDVGYAQVNVQEGLECNSDPQLTELVLNHLLGNALKFARHRKHPVISVYRIQRQGMDYFVVEDNGSGFSMEFVGRLFAPFQRLHQQDDVAGVGIGLATVARVIQRHGGDVWAEAEMDQGARFGFRFNGESANGRHS